MVMPWTLIVLAIPVVSSFSSSVHFVQSVVLCRQKPVIAALPPPLSAALSAALPPPLSAALGASLPIPLFAASWGATSFGALPALFNPIWPLGAGYGAAIASGALAALFSSTSSVVRLTPAVALVVVHVMYGLRLFLFLELRRRQWAEQRAISYKFSEALPPGSFPRFAHMCKSAVYLTAMVAPVAVALSAHAVSPIATKPTLHSWLPISSASQAELAMQALRHLPWSGVIIAAAALLLQTIADAQHQSFKRSRPAGFPDSWCDRGLWRFLRRPNLSAEAVFWLGVHAATLPALLQLRSAPLALLVAGGGFAHAKAIIQSAARLEARRSRRYGTAYERHKAVTPLFVPWPKALFAKPVEDLGSGATAEEGSSEKAASRDPQSVKVSEISEGSSTPGGGMGATTTSLDIIFEVGVDDSELAGGGLLEAGGNGKDGGVSQQALMELLYGGEQAMPDLDDEVKFYDLPPADEDSG